MAETSLPVDLPVLGELPKLPADRLRGLERFTIAVCDAINTTGWLKDFIQFFVRTVTGTWTRAISERRWKLDNFEPIRTLRPSKGVILVSNHRSFFDMYVCSSVLYRHANFLSRLIFPVRADFFYTSLVGLLVNIGISGGAMWPPVFRDDRKAELNPIGMRQMIHVLEQRGVVLGIHPEGTRGKGPDEYAFLPAKPGVGRLVKAVDPETLILPFFIAGMGNDLKEEVRILMKRPPGSEIRLRYGTPIRVGDLDRDRMTPLEIAQQLLGVIGELGEEDRQERIAAGLVPSQRAAS